MFRMISIKCLVLAGLLLSGDPGLVAEKKASGFSSLPMQVRDRAGLHSAAVNSDRPDDPEQPRAEDSVLGRLIFL